MPKIAKKQKAAREQVDRTKKYTLVEACALVKKAAPAKFDETVDLAVRLGVNPRHADQMVRGAVVLPHGTGQSLRVLVFAKGEKAKEAEANGADFVGAEELVAKVQEGFMDFDRVIATPDMMALVGRLGKVLGPRGLMPNPRVGTVTPNVGQAVKDAKGGSIEFRTEKTGIVHAPVGKMSFGPDKLRENILSLLDTLQRLKPSTAKGKYFKSIALSSTMGPSVRLDTNEVAALLER